MKTLFWIVLLTAIFFEWLRPIYALGISLTLGMLAAAFSAAVLPRINIMGVFDKGEPLLKPVDENDVQAGQSFSGCFANVSERSGHVVATFKSADQRWPWFMEHTRKVDVFRRIIRILRISTFPINLRSFKGRSPY